MILNYYFDGILQSFEKIQPLKAVEIKKMNIFMISLDIVYTLRKMFPLNAKNVSAIAWKIRKLMQSFKNLQIYAAC